MERHPTHIMNKMRARASVQGGIHMAASLQSIDSIDSNGYPLCFKVAQGLERPGVLGLENSACVFTTQARAMGGHQKEAVVTEGDKGSSWRMVSDEGPALKGTDLAPFPLGFMSAGLQADLLQRIYQLSIRHDLPLKRIESELVNNYVFEGSFFKGTGHGQAHRPRFAIRAESDIGADRLLALVHEAAAASPLLAAWAAPLTNTFALYANGRRVGLRQLNASSETAFDPLKVWANAPQPLINDNTSGDIITKAEPVKIENPTSPSGWETGKVEIPIHGRSVCDRGLTRSVTWANRLGGSAFAIRSNDRLSEDLAPSGLAHAFAGIAFCFMTQLLRYVEHHDMKVRALRLVQFSPCKIETGIACAVPLDTHVFVRSEESDEVMERLVLMAARTCYLHAALHAALSPDISVTLNGADITV
jgi:hypothetical protein